MGSDEEAVSVKCPYCGLPVEDDSLGSHLIEKHPGVVPRERIRYQLWTKGHLETLNGLPPF
jgi:hypothetical protein